jgi:hypothetical protein
MNIQRAMMVGGILALLALVLIWGDGRDTIRMRVTMLPEFELVVGNLRLIGDRTIMPVCPQLINPGCVSSDPVPPIEIYTIWLFERAQAGSWEGASMRQLLVVRSTR